MRIVLISDQRSRPSYTKAFIGQVLLLSMLFGPGLLFDSPAMQWAGFMFLLLIGVSWIIALHSESKFLTIEEAKEKLNELGSSH